MMFDRSISGINVVIRSSLQMQKACGTHRAHLPYVHPNPKNQPRPTFTKAKSKHWNRDFWRERRLKIEKVELPDFKEKDMNIMKPDELRLKFKEMGLQPFRSSNDKPFSLTTCGKVLDRYIPPEGDGKASIISKERGVQAKEFMKHKGKSKLSIRRIRKYEEDFYPDEFAENALETYKKMHECLVDFDKEKLHDLVTESAYPMIVYECENKHIRWNFLGSLEPPYIVQSRDEFGIDENTKFAQITVRFHTKQTLAIYDRFGRLMYGSDIVAKDLLEYVVFEKVLTNPHGLWRLHAKIVPSWMPNKPNSFITYKEEAEEDEDDEEAVTEQTKEEAVSVNDKPLATA